MPPRQKVDLEEYGVITFSRQEFLDEVWTYQPGEHVTFLAPTGGGKTQLGFELLGKTATPDLQATILVMKPRDSTVTRFCKENEFKITRDWPPSAITKIGKKPPGYAVWPKETGNLYRDKATHRAVFEKVINANYYKGQRITFADETYSLEKEMGLSEELNRVWTKGRSMENGLWASSQRPAWMSRFAYQAHHLFLGRDPDVDTQKRYGEIGGGVKTEVVQALTASLKKFQFVYILRDAPTDEGGAQICIVDR